METIRAAMTAHLLGAAPGPLAGIYLVTHCASGLRYVGQSRDIARRWTDHRKGRGDSRRLTNAIRKHGPNAFAFEIVELCAPEELNDREAFYVWAFDCLSPGGYNLRSGGGQAESLSEEARAKIAESTKAAMIRPEVRARVLEGTRKATSSPQWQEQNRRKLDRLNTDPEIRARSAEAARRRFSDPTTYTIINVHTGERDTGTRADFLVRHDIDGSWFGELLKGKRKTARGWMLSGTDAPGPIPAAPARATKPIHRAGADPTIYVLTHYLTGAVERGTRRDLRPRLGISESNFSNLVAGRSKSVRGYRLARPEEIQ